MTSTSTAIADERPLRVAIIGGGIGGLTLGVALNNPVPVSFSSSEKLKENNGIAVESGEHATNAIGHPAGSVENENVDKSVSGVAGSTSSRSDQATAKLDVQIYESATRFTEIGAGVGLWLRTFRYMSSADFLSENFKDDLEKIADRALTTDLRNAFEFRTGCSTISEDGKEGVKAGVSFFQMNVPFGVLTLHRADFQAALAARFPTSHANFKKRLVQYDYRIPESGGDEEIVLQFADGTTATCDILIGADGIHSATRRRMLSEEDLSEKQITTLTTPMWSGTIVYRALLSRPLLDASFPGEDGKGHRASRGHVVYFGPNKHVLAFPISQGRFVNLVAFVSEPDKEGIPFPGAWVAKTPRDDEGTKLWDDRYERKTDDEDEESIGNEVPDSFQPEMRQAFEGWDKEVIALLDLAENPSRWAIHTMRPLPSYASKSGKVAILGDAAHAMTPHQGAGGGQAIEDALVLSSLLKHPRLSKSTLPLALKAYDEIRRPVARGVAEKARLNGMLFQLSKGDAWGGTRYRNVSELDDAASAKPLINGANSEDFGGYYDFHSSDVGLIRAASSFDASAATAAADGSGLAPLTEAIINIHKWEWAADPFDQREEAIRVFEELI